MSDHSRRFLLKVWNEPGQGAGAERAWRATLRDVVDGSLHEFSATDELIGYLTSLGEAARVVGSNEEVDG